MEPPAVLATGAFELFDMYLIGVFRHFSGIPLATLPASPDTEVLCFSPPFGVFCKFPPFTQAITAQATSPICPTMPVANDKAENGLPQQMPTAYDNFQIRLDMCQRMLVS